MVTRKLTFAERPVHAEPRAEHGKGAVPLTSKMGSGARQLKVGPFSQRYGQAPP